MEIISYTQEGKILVFKRRPLFWIISAVSVIFLLILVIFFINNALVKITYAWESEARESDIEVTAISGDIRNQGDPIGFMVGDYAFIPRSTSVIAVNSESSETIRHIEQLPFFSVPDINLSLKPQSKLIKRGGGSQGCNLLVNDRTYTHDCANTETSEFAQPTNDRWHLRELANDGVSNIFSRYKDGFLELAYTEIGERPTTLRYLSVGNSMQEVASAQLPEGFVSQEAQEPILIYTDQTNPSGPFVVGNLDTGEFLLYDEVSSEPVDTFSAPENISPEFESTICNLTAGQFTCYYGQTAAFHDNIDEHQAYLEQDDGLNLRGTLEIRQVNDIQTTQTYDRRIEFGVNELHQDDDHNIYTLSEDSLILLDPGEDIRYRLIADNVVNVTSNANGAVYTRQGGVYSYESSDDSSYLRFRSDRLVLGGISSYNNTVLFNGFVQTEDNTGIRSIAQVYQLTDTPLPASETRVEDVLPFGDADENIGSMDYNDDYIEVAVIPAFGVSGQAQGLRYDREGTLARRDEILQKLQDLNAIGDREVLFFIYGTSDNPQL